MSGSESREKVRSATTADDGRRPWQSTAVWGVTLAALAGVLSAYSAGTLDVGQIIEAVGVVLAAWGFRRRM